MIKASTHISNLELFAFYQKKNPTYSKITGVKPLNQKISNDRRRTDFAS